MHAANWPPNDACCKLAFFSSRLLSVAVLACITTTFSTVAVMYSYAACEQEQECAARVVWCVPLKSSN
eukprot:363937-Chlamydomonas_euryale.AAC.15